MRLKVRRIEKRLTQCELADKIGISRYYLSALERGKAKNPSIAVMKAISKELDTPVQELFFSEEE
ncbi:helix-turn-helix transcriptional regulator [Clostridium sp. HV4-5-A1G]|uniref:helix-turn-helix transcriptional regulator n=1 Tax=Clostridium sp. HV4-5-A1G TaxID=2004595 RepID=UPI00123859CC|nr:helix-turn-helix transcriptional regulator [Clostridium sp. HV4-5-A1G]KAA8673392.1 helix-turn-helix transcriptional regulator [Clostridium sp. HV4-5-A1G]